MDQIPVRFASAHVGNCAQESAMAMACRLSAATFLRIPERLLPDVS